MQVLHILINTAVEGNSLETVFKDIHQMMFPLKVKKKKTLDELAV